MSEYTVAVFHANAVLSRDSIDFDPDVIGQFGYARLIKAFESKLDAVHKDKLNMSDGYERAGELTLNCESLIQALDIAWSRSQNCEDAWNPNRPCRSSMLGDIFVAANWRTGESIRAIVGRYGFCTFGIKREEYQDDGVQVA